ncbi:MAG: hypothetical protein ACKORL_12405, partial [Phycisphaerales bacterium]
MQTSATAVTPIHATPARDRRPRRRRRAPWKEVFASRSTRQDFHARNVTHTAMPEAKRSGTPTYAPRTASSVPTATAASATSSGHERSWRRSAAAAARVPARSTEIAGPPWPKRSASFGHVDTQSMHFMQPVSTTMPESRTSSWTRTLSVHPAVQWPHCSQRSWS